MLPIVAVEGRVVGEPEIRFGDSGKALTRFRMKAADRRRTDDGKWEDGDVLWLTVTSFGTLAENVSESLVDGDQVVVIGKWSTAEWVDQAGTKRSAPRFVAQAVGAGLQFQPRRHSADTRAKHRPAAAPSGEPSQPNAYFGRQFADVAVAGESGQGKGGDAPTGDPWS